MPEAEKSTVASPVPASTPAAAVQATPPAAPVTEAKPETTAPVTSGKVVHLKYPFKSGEKTLTEVAFTRRPRAKDLIRSPSEGSAAEQELHGIAALLGVIPEDLMEMDGADYLAVQKEWSAFLLG